MDAGEIKSNAKLTGRPCLRKEQERLCLSLSLHIIGPDSDRQRNDPMKPVQRQGEMENQVKNAIIKFEQEFMGRGPDEVKAFIVRDLIVIRLKGVLTPAERQLAKTAEGIEMVKRLRQNLIAQGRDKLMEQMNRITGAKATALFTDIDTQIGERVFVFTMDRDLEAGFSKT